MSSSSYRWFLKCNGYNLSHDDLQCIVGYFVVYLHSDLREVQYETIDGCLKYIDSHYEEILKYVQEKGCVEIELNNDKVLKLEIQQNQGKYPIPQIIKSSIYTQKIKIVKPNPYDSDVYNFLYDCNGHQHLAYVELYQIAMFFSNVLNLKITKEDLKLVSSIIIFMTKHFLQIAKYLIENKIVEIQLPKKKIMLQFVLLSRYPVYHRAFIY